MAKIKYTNEQLCKLISDLEVEFKTELKKAEFPLESKDAAKDDDAKEDKEDESKDVAAKDKEEHESKESPEQEAKEHKDDAKEDSKDVAADDFDYDDEDMDELHKMYSSMGAKEKDAHLGALHKAIGIVQKSEDLVKKEELEKLSVQKDEEIKLVKTENEELKSKNAALSKDIEVVSEFLKSLKEKKPVQKAVTSISHIQKSETVESEEKILTKSEVNAILNRKIESGNLTSQDKSAIYSYYLSNSPIETIKHLLK